MPGPLVSSAATSALMTTSLGEFPKQTLIAARARVKCGSCPSTSECVARAGSGRWRTWRRWIRTFDSWSRDRQTVMGGGPALETGEDLSGNRRFESITLHQRVRYETFPATPADRRVDQEAAITPGLHQLTSARRAAPSPPPNRRCTKIVGMPSSLVIAIGGDHTHRQIGEGIFFLAPPPSPSMPRILMPG